MGRKATNCEFTILLYHGVCSDDLKFRGRNSSGKHLRQSVFHQQMTWLKHNRPVVSMRDIASAYRGETTLPSDAVAVTFDDGFRNNLVDAWPVLEQTGIPATIYLATGFIGEGRIIWTDRLESALLDTGKTQLTFTAGDQAYSFTFGTLEDRIRAFAVTKKVLKTLSNSEKDTTLEMIEAQLGASGDPSDPLYAFLSWDEVRQLNRSPLIDFGAHTVNHVPLARVPPAVMRREIEGSVATVEAELGQRCTLFSYPEGQAQDFDPAVIDVLKGLGFDHCPTAMNGRNSLHHTDPFHLRRFIVGIEGAPFPFEGAVP